MPPLPDQIQQRPGHPLKARPPHDRAEARAAEVAAPEARAAKASNIPMDSGAFQKFCQKRAERARNLCGTRAEAAEALTFLAKVAELQASTSLSLASLVALLRSNGPVLLRRAADAMNEAAGREAIGRYRSREDTGSPRSFFARVLLQPEMAQRENAESLSHPERCPRCGHLPQLGCLHALGDGRQLSLQCSLCFFEWPHPRGRCAACGEEQQDKIAFYAASEIPNVEVQTCSECRGYLHLVDATRDAQVVPEVEEVGAIALDVWARGKGFSKIQPNLVGI